MMVAGMLLVMAVGIVIVVVGMMMMVDGVGEAAMAVLGIAGTTAVMSIVITPGMLVVTVG
jgi:hypothetical protein